MFCIFLFLSLIYLVNASDSYLQENCPVLYPCNNTYFHKSEVEDYCAKYDLKMDGRCCFFNSTIIGLDLRYCEIKTLNISQPIFSQIEILDLRDNEYEKMTSKELIGLLKLNILYLSQHIPCPGGHTAWNVTDQSNNMTTCSEQLDPCVSLNISCGEPSDANCHHLGPGTAKCICSPGHFGYKCLNEGTFPVAIFSSSVIIPCVVLSTALWFIQGRDPYRKELVQM